MNQFSSNKILRHLERIVEWQKTGISRPITYELDMTNLCDSKCPFCFGFYNRESERYSIKVEDAKDIIRQIKEFGGKAVTFTGGGEPLCNHATFEAVKYAKQIGLDIGFITNGILLTEEKAKILVDSCRWIRISLDAGSPEVYEYTHGLDGKTFEKILKNISLLARIKNQRGLGVTIGTGFLTFPEVTKDMIPFVLVSRDAGVDYAQFRPLLKSFDEEEMNSKPDLKIIDEIKNCLNFSKDNFQVLYSKHKYENMENGTVRRNYKRCYGHHFATVIAANRKMYLCCHMRGLKKYCIGDLSRISLKEIWKSEERRKIFENIDFNNCPLLCRGDNFNIILWGISQEKTHEKFL